jgi:phosphatidylglycerophosphate synthase
MIKAARFGLHIHSGGVMSVSTVVSKPWRLGVRAISTITAPGIAWLVAHNDRWYVRRLPNALTWSRLAVPVTTAICVIYFRAGKPGAATWLFLLTVLLIATDIVDGKVARRLGVVSEFGKYLDPALDKLTLLSISAGFLVALGSTSLSAWWLLAAVLMTAIRLYYDVKLIVLTDRGRKLLKKQHVDASSISGAGPWGKRKFRTDCLTMGVAWPLLIWVGSARWTAVIPLCLGFPLAIVFARRSITGHIDDFHRVMSK